MFIHSHFTVSSHIEIVWRINALMNVIRFFVQILIGLQTVEFIFRVNLNDLENLLVHVWLFPHVWD